ncbi:MAG: phage terminase large subunit [Oscillospiraceae bacterium]|nr:phage terminase large subunit [Oscillospiraceae bacterium]
MAISSKKSKKAESIFDMLKFITESKVPDPEGNIIELLKNTELPENKINIMSAMLAGTAKKGMSGDLKSLEWIIEMLGLRQSSEKIPGYSGIPGYLLGKTYVDIYRDITERRHRFYDFKGGRGSLKSSFCALVMIDEIMRNSHFCGIALRQVKDTLKDSVYSQLIWAIDKLGFSEYFKCTESSPMQITRTDTGQIIYFRGCDEPVKIKSIKPPGDMYIGVIWFEEKDQLKGPESVRNILQSVMRGGDDIIVLSSYNTPISRRHFLNLEETHQSPLSKGGLANRIIHHSFYYDSPPEWLGQPFLDEAEYLKETNEKAYRHEYLGEAVGEGGNVFDNVSIREIKDAEIKTFGALYYGLDFGWIDPFAFNCVCYDPNRLTLYIFNELHGYKTANRDLAKLLKPWGNCDIIADSANPKDIADLRGVEICVRGAMKGQGSVQMGMKWLQSLKEIVIDPVRCPHTAGEFTAYEYEKSSDGEIITSYPDKNNHHIDAVRYSMSAVIRRYGE